MVTVCTQRVSVTDKDNECKIRMCSSADPVLRSDTEKLANTRDQRKTGLAVSKNSYILDGQIVLRDQIRVLQFTAEVMLEIFGASLREQRLFLWHAEYGEDRRAPTVCQGAMKYMPVSQCARSFWALFPELLLTCVTLCQSSTLAMPWFPYHKVGTKLNLSFFDTGVRVSVCI